MPTAKDKSRRQRRFASLSLLTAVLTLALGAVHVVMREYLGFGYLVTLGTVTCIAAAVAYMMAAWLERTISGPVAELAAVVSQVTAGRDYSVRAAQPHDGELGRLVAGFNDMLGQIQARDAELQRAHDELEHRVAERTREVAREQARFQRIFEAVPVGISLTRVAPGEPKSRVINDAHLRMCGLTREQTQEPGIFSRVTHPDDRARQEPLNARLAAGEIDHYRLEKRYVLPDGSVRWVSFCIERHRSPDGSHEDLSTVSDITDLKNAQEETLRQQARFKFIFDSVPVGFSWMVLGDLSSRIVNPAHARITGVPMERCRELDLYRQATPAEERARQDELHRRLLAGEIDRYEIEKRYVHPDGGVHWAALTIHLNRDPASGQTQEINTLVDITKRKQAEARLAEASGLLDAMLANSPDFIYFKDRESRFVRFSQACLARLGVSDPAALRGKTDADFFSPKHAAPALADEQAIIRTGEPIVGKLEKETHPDGRVTWALTTKMPWRDGTGAIVGTFGISKDVTPLIEAEHRVAYERDQLRALIDSSPDAIYFKDLQSRFVLVSHSKVRKALARGSDLRARRISLGLKPDVPEPSMLDGLTDFDIYGGDAAQRAFDDEQQIIRTGEPIVAKIEKQTYHDGSLIWHSTSKMPWRDRDGKIIGTFGISKDITDLKEAEAKLEEMHKQLLQTSRQAGMAEVATGVLHNVGNVLNSVNVSATLVADHVRRSKASNVAKLATLFDQHKANLPDFLTHDPRGQMIPSYLGTLAEMLAAEHNAVVVELENLRKNIEHIKDVVAMQQAYARTSGVLETVSVPDMIEDALRINAGSLARHDVDTERDYQARPVVTTDKHKVMQILINLVQNAKYACDESGRTDKRIVVRATADDKGVKIEVVDNGIGIAPENLLRIFNHGFTTRKTGHGFGLHSGALAAKELGGSLSVESAGPGHGASFSLRLPYTTETPLHESDES